VQFNKVNLFRVERQIVVMSSWGQEREEWLGKLVNTYYVVAGKEKDVLVFYCTVGDYRQQYHTLCFRKARKKKISYAFTI
jgi:L-amino acid N-acyltransferase YncA